MKKEDLVVLKGNVEVTFECSVMKPHSHYRCAKISENNITQYMVYGTIFDEVKFNELFEFSQIRLLRDFKELGLVTNNGRPLSKNQFNEKANIHVYGKKRQKFYRFYFYKNPKESLYMFEALFIGVKQIQLLDAYTNYTSIFLGNMESLDNGLTQFGNCGLPLSNTNLRIEY